MDGDAGFLAPEYRHYDSGMSGDAYVHGDAGSLLSGGSMDDAYASGHHVVVGGDASSLPPGYTYHGGQYYHDGHVVSVDAIPGYQYHDDSAYAMG
ncbi:unnamed protein product, partial [Symbiodinium pilosum]